MRVRACPSQAEQLVAWAQSWPGRAWAVEGAAGLGHLLAQQLVAAGEYVVDVPPKLAARVRLLEAGDTNKNDPNDALSVAVAALRSKTPRPVIAEDHAAVLKLWAKRHRDLSRARNQAACRLHAVLCDLVPGGVPDEITAARAESTLGQIRPWSAAAGARCELASEFLADIRNLDAQRRAVKKKLAAAVKASGTSLTRRVFGVGPVIAGTVIGDVRQVSRFSRDHFAAYNSTAGRGVVRERKIYRLSLKEPAAQSCDPYGPIADPAQTGDGRAYCERKIARQDPGRRCAASSAESATRSTQHSWRRPAGGNRLPGGRGATGEPLCLGAGGSHPQSSLFGQALPGLTHPTASSRFAASASSRPPINGAGDWPSLLPRFGFPGRAGPESRSAPRRTNDLDAGPPGPIPAQRGRRQRDAGARTPHSTARARNGCG
jgi:transposase